MVYLRRELYSKDQKGETYEVNHTTEFGAGIFAKEAHLPAIAALQGKVLLTAIYSRSSKSVNELGALVKEVLGVPADAYCDEDPKANLDALLAS